MGRIAVIFWLVTLMPAAALAEAVTVFAAASLKGPLDQAVRDWPGPAVEISYGASSVLARQIEAGAPADVFLSANPGWMDMLAGGGLIDQGSRIDLLSNRVVLAGPSDHPALPLGDLPSALGEGRLATALTTAVPLGLYAREALQGAGLWEDVKGSLAEADTARAALAFLRRDEVPYAILYASDVAASDAVAIVAEFPESAQPLILYPAARVQGGDDHGLLEHLASREGRAPFLAAGFAPVPAARVGE